MKNAIITIALVLCFGKSFSQVKSPSEVLNIDCFRQYKGFVFLHREKLYNKWFYDSSLKRHYKFCYVSAGVDPINKDVCSRPFVIKYKNWKKKILLEVLEYKNIDIIGGDQEQPYQIMDRFNTATKINQAFFIKSANKKAIKEYKKEMSWLLYKSQIKETISYYKTI